MTAAHPVPSEGSISDERMPDWRISQIADEHRTTFDGKEHLDEISFARSLLSQSRVGAGGEQAARLLTLEEVRKVWETCQSYDQAGPAIQRKFCEVNGIQLAATTQPTDAGRKQ